jgi:uncharacterized protein YqcC (DUF446 family)
MMDTFQPYELVLIKASEIEAELKRLNRWNLSPLPAEKYDDMGAFGENTMSFEQWLQFILIPRINEIIENKGEFPEGSMLGPYAIRYFDGDHEADDLHQLLYDLDTLINKKTHGEESEWKPSFNDETSATDYAIPEQFLNSTIPPVVFTLAELLHQFEGEDLESQLQTFDIFLGSLVPFVRPQFGEMLKKAAARATNENTKARIQQAAESVLSGGRAAAPYDHEAAMKKYREDFKKQFHKSS